MAGPSAAMNSAKTSLRRVRSLGWPVLLTGFAFLLAVVALLLPVWTFQRDTGGGDIDRWTYGWTSVVEEEWTGGVLARTTITPYASPTFDQFRLREAIGPVYLVATVYLMTLIALGGVHYVARPRHLPQSVLLGTNLLVSIVGISALILPMALIPPAASAEVKGVVSGFSGQATVAGDVFSWGAAPAWWLWVVSVSISLVVLVLPWLTRTLRIQSAPAH